MDEEKSLGRTGGVRRRCAAVLVLLFCMAAVIHPAWAAEGAEQVRRVIPLGHTVGVKLYAEGLLVVNLSESTDGQGNPSPARACGIRTGDIILEMNEKDLDSTEDLQEALQKNGDRPVSLTVKRGSRTLSLTTTPESGADGVYRLGAWVRDSIAGIGTLTYYDPENGTFGALGHGITDTDTMQLMSLSAGSLMPSTVAEVKKGGSGVPGELVGAFQMDKEIGKLTCNSSLGIFGTLEDASFAAGEAVEVASADEVRCGRATILANITGDQVEEFGIKIVKKTAGAGDGKDLVIRVTDERLLNETGGIVQGMSGSPILQNGKIVGAVTHVLVNDPSRGYGILIETMLDAAE